MKSIKFSSNCSLLFRFILSMFLIFRSFQKPQLQQQQHPRDARQPTVPSPPSKTTSPPTVPTHPTPNTTIRDPRDHLDLLDPPLREWEWWLTMLGTSRDCLWWPAPVNCFLSTWTITDRMKNSPPDLPDPPSLRHHSTGPKHPTMSSSDLPGMLGVTLKALVIVLEQRSSRSFCLQILNI